MTNFIQPVPVGSHQGAPIFKNVIGKMNHQPVMFGCRRALAQSQYTYLFIYFRSPYSIVSLVLKVEQKSSVFR